MRWVFLLSVLPETGNMTDWYVSNSAFPQLNEHPDQLWSGIEAGGPHFGTVQRSDITIPQNMC